MAAQLNSSRPQVAILDFGSQFSHLIARRVRELNVFCELFSCKVPLETLRKNDIQGIILSGGPNSVFDPESPHLDDELWNYFLQNNIPVLGICYGMQELVHKLGGTVEASEKREYGFAEINVMGSDSLMSDISSSTVWMSHGDKVLSLPESFTALAKTESTPFAAMASSDGRNIYGVQFHPEVTHSLCGKTILKNFCVSICGMEQTWKMSSLKEDLVAYIKKTVGEDKHVIGAVSGGVDSSVAAVLMNHAIGERFHAVLVDNGVLRKNEAVEVEKRLKNQMGINLTVIDGTSRFMEKLKDVKDPETKRKAIGNLFIDIFQEHAKKLEASNGIKIDYLLQGTLYPDVIESISYKGPSSLIKSHHNVGGLPEEMELGLIEPLRELFKDEVRSLGRELGLPEESISRHPFPGPGLAIRILGDVDQVKVKKLQECDAIMIEEIRKAGVYNEIGQAFCVLLPVKSVGVQGDFRTYENVVSIRCVTTSDFMTADWYRMDYDLVARISSRIINEVKGVNRVCYDVSSKPPATIEWE